MNMPLSNIETNTVKGSQVSVVYDCNHLWASGQLRAISLLKAQKTCPLRGQYSEVVREFRRAGRAHCSGVCAVLPGTGTGL